MFEYSEITNCFKHCPNFFYENGWCPITDHIGNVSKTENRYE